MMTSNLRFSDQYRQTMPPWIACCWRHHAKHPCPTIICHQVFCWSWYTSSFTILSFSDDRPSVSAYSILVDDDSLFCLECLPVFA